MSLFEFLMVLVSLIIGLGIAEILSGVARTIRFRATVVHYWAQSVVAAAIFFALLQQWWEIWGLRHTPQWTFPGLLMMLGGPIGLYLIAHLLYPEPIRGANFRTYYYTEMRPAWWIACATVLVASSFRPLIIGETLFALHNLTSFAGLAIFIVLGLTRNPTVHAILTPAILGSILADVLLINFSIA